MRVSQVKVARARNNKLIFYTLMLYGLLAFNVLGSGGCKWNSDYRTRIQPSAELTPLSVEEGALQDAINESEPESLKSMAPAKPVPPVADLPI